MTIKKFLAEKREQNEQFFEYEAQKLIQAGFTKDQALALVKCIINIGFKIREDQNIGFGL